MEDEVERIVDPELKVALFRQIARIYAEEVGDVPSAEGMLQNILTITEGDVAALDELARLGEKEERYDKQITALENKFKKVDEDHERKGILFEIARIWEDRVGELDEALDALNRVLEIDGSDPNALSALARIYQQESRWHELAHVLTRKVELSQETSENVALRMQVAQLCEGELADAEAAIQWYRGVLDFEANHGGGAERLGAAVHGP